MVSPALTKVLAFRSSLNSCLLETKEHQSEEPTFCTIKKLGKELKNFKEDHFEGKYEIGEFVRCLVLYAEVLFNFSRRNTASRRNITVVKFFLTEISELINTVELRNHFAISWSEKIFKILLDDNIRPWFAKPLLRTYNTIIQGSDKKLRSELFNSIGMIVLCKLINKLSQYGDYEYQTMIIEVLYRLCSVDTIKKHAAQFITESPELAAVLSQINVKKFDEDVRKFLNKFNSKRNNAFSTTCTWIKLDDLTVEEAILPEDLWVDFDLVDRSISWNYRRSFIQGPDSSSISVLGTETNDWEFITLLGSHVQTFDTERIDNQLLVTMRLNAPCITTSGYLQPTIDKMRSLQLLMNDSTKSDHVVENVLPEMFNESHQIQKITNISGKRRPSTSDCSVDSATQTFFKRNRLQKETGESGSIQIAQPVDSNEVTVRRTDDSSPASKPKNRTINNNIKRKKTKSQNKRTLSEIYQVLDKMREGRVPSVRAQRIRRMSWKFCDQFAEFKKKKFPYFDQTEDNSPEKPAGTSDRDGAERKRKVGQLPWTFSDLVGELEKNTPLFVETKLNKKCDELKRGMSAPDGKKTNSKFKIFSNVLISSKFPLKVSREHFGTRLNASEGE